MQFMHTHLHTHIRTQHSHTRTCTNVLSQGKKPFCYSYQAKELLENGGPGHLMYCSSLISTNIQCHIFCVSHMYVGAIIYYLPVYKFFYTYR